MIPAPGNAFRILHVNRQYAGLANVVPNVAAESILVDFWDVRRQLGIPPAQRLHIVADIDGTVLSEDEQCISPVVGNHFGEQRASGAVASITLASNSVDPKKYVFGEQIASDCRVFTALQEDDKLYRKPHRRYFSHIQQECQFGQDSVMMIGDKCLRDILGARRVGWYSMMVRPWGNRQPRTDAWFLRPIDAFALRIGTWAMLSETIQQYMNM
jgi:predicted HAD superfamily phosphohydrolase YqeG